MKVWVTGITTKIWENNRSGLSTLNENGTKGGAEKEVIFTGRNEVVAKVIFLHLSVIHSVHRAGLPQCMLGYPPPEQTPPQSRHPPWTRPPGRRHLPWEADSSIRSTRGRYASYWNAFLYAEMFTLKYRAQHRKQKKNIMTSSLLSVYSPKTMTDFECCYGIHFFKCVCGSVLQLIWLRVFTSNIEAANWKFNESLMLQLSTRTIKIYWQDHKITWDNKPII